jgi:CDP-diacylglycerol--serine O-phosphatidyltransferase
MKESNLKVRSMKAGVAERWHRRRFLVPNAVTLANMFCGFLGIIYASSDRFEKAAIAIGVAILLDGLDGRLARRLNATSKFGVELDSFSDFISFGIAPAMIVYHWAFRVPADEFGVIVTFIYCLCAGSRLARFNIMESSGSNFEGLPSPGAAAMVAALINFYPVITPTRPMLALMTVIMVGLGFLMISKIEFFSIKRLKVNRLNKPLLVLLGFAIALVWYDSGKGFLILSAGYALSGPLGAVMRTMFRKQKPTEVVDHDVAKTM